MSLPLRLAIVVSHPTQYYSPWFRAIVATSGCALRVFYLWDFGVTARHDPRFQQTFQWDVDLLSGYDHEFVPNVASAPGTERFSSLHNPELPARLTAWRPDAILLFGYRYRTHLQLIRWARRVRIPLIFRGDSHLLAEPCPSLPKRLLLHWIYTHFAAVTYVGAANRDYFTAFGVPPQKLFFAPHAVDHTHFNPQFPAHHTAARRLRESLGLRPEERVILFAGKFSCKKQPLLLLDAFNALRPVNTTLVLAGDGEQRGALERAAADAPAPVRFLPFANQSEMPARYLLADLFVLPSRGRYETWGLAVNEAMHMGVPCLVSDHVGCQRDLVTESETGWVFPANEPGALQAALARALEQIATDVTALRERVAARISRYTYARATEGLLAAARAVLA